MGGEGEMDGGVEGSPTILSIYMKGVYKNLQGESSDYPQNSPHTDPSAGSTWWVQQHEHLFLPFVFEYH